MSNSHRRSTLIAAGVIVVMIGLCVRFPITAVSPLLIQLGDSFGLDSAGLAVLSATPVLLFGLASPLAPVLVRRIGLERALLVLLVALAAAGLLRPLSTPLLYAGTVVVGASIALLGILTPQLIRHFLDQRAGLWTGIYTTSFGISAAVGAALTVPLFHAIGDQAPAALIAWGVPLAAAALIGAILLPRLRAASPAAAQAAGPPAGPIRHAPGLWAVTGFFGCQALIYFSLTSWLPTIYTDRGLAPAEAGLLLALMSIAGLPASLLAPTLASKPAFRTPLIVGLSILSGIGLIGVAFGPTALAPIMVCLLGIAQSAAFGIAIGLIIFTAPSVAQTSTFSAFSQGVGYTFAAIGPLAMGLMSAAGIPWSAIVACLLAAVLGQAVFGVAGSRASQARKRALLARVDA